MEGIRTCLWFDDQAEDAVRAYVDLVPGSRITAVSRYGDTGPGEPGSVLTVEFELGGQAYLAINGGATHVLTPAVSIVLTCADQAEIDRYWTALLADGGQESRCGWLVDRFGLSWQVVPAGLGDLLSGGGDAARAARVTEAMLAMDKLHLPTLQAAYDGG